jgi:hypothetical protein
MLHFDGILDNFTLQMFVSKKINKNVPNEFLKFKMEH